VDDAQPTVAGSLLSGYVSVLDRRGLLPSVRAAVSERTRALIDDPPLAIAWVEASVMEEMMGAIHQLHGREAVREIALENARTKAGPIVIPFMRTLLALWGATPESLFKHMHRLVAIQARGLHVSYIPGTPTSGTMELVYPRGSTDAVYATWEGACQLAFEVCKVQGTVCRAEVSDGGRKARIAIRWSPR